MFEKEIKHPKKQQSVDFFLIISKQIWKKHISFICSLDEKE
jgi:hypothetical protein